MSNRLLRLTFFAEASLAHELVRVVSGRGRIVPYIAD